MRVIVALEHEPRTGRDARAPTVEVGQVLARGIDEDRRAPRALRRMIEVQHVRAADVGAA